MPEKKANGQQYKVSGKVFTWTTEDGDTVTIPMRIKLKTIRAMSGRELDVAAMFDMLEVLVPDQAEVLDEMDVNDFQRMFSTWQEEYTALSGATPGE